jgi:phosphoribosylformylglycinamidine synthase
VQWASQGCLGIETRFLWHEERDLQGLDAVVIPGGFSYGDYLRCGAIARFAPVLEEVAAFARRGGRVLGICNGFQVLTELGLLPGALTRNQHLHFLCEPAELQVEPGRCQWLQGYQGGERVTFPIAHGEGRYQLDADQLKAVEDSGQVVLRYCRNPNGSVGDVAGLTNAEGNVLGLMPHPERACDPITGGEDGRRLLASLLG